jgi:hypothetical protein
MASSTIVLSQASASTRQFTGGNQLYGTLTYTVASSTGQLTITGSNTFSTLNVSGGVRTLALSQAITTVTNFNVFGTAGNLVNVISSTVGTKALLGRPNGAPVSTDYINVRDIAYTVPYGFYVGTSSTDSGNNANVIFTAPVTVPYIYEVDAPGQQATATNNTVNFSTPQSGSLLVYSLAIQNAFGTMTDPTGWTLAVQKSQSTNTHLWIWYKISDGTETSVTATWTTSRVATGTMYQARGFTGTPTLDGIDSNGSVSATTLSTGVGVSNTTNPAIVFAFVGGNGGIGASVGTPTNSFQEDYTLGLGSASISAKSAVKLITSNASQSTTFSWNTARVPAAVLAIFKDSAASSGNFFELF